MVNSRFRKNACKHVSIPSTPHNRRKQHQLREYYPPKPNVMKKLIVVFSLLAQFAAAQDSVELTIYFEDGSSIPSMPEMAMLDDIAQHPNSEQLRFCVVGHTDDKGSRKFNVELSKERTQRVAYHLLLSGIRPYNILFENHGEDCPVNENADEDARAENRRVEVLISNVGKLEKPGFAGRYREGLFDCPIKNATQNTEVFVIENQESNCIETSNGTFLDVPPMAFMDAYGRPIGGKVELTYEEYNNPFSVFLSGVSMKADPCEPNNHIETAGMFSINATHRGKPVEVRKDRPVQVYLASSSMENNYDFLFLDPSSERWSNLGVATINAEDAELIQTAENLSPAVRQYLTATDYLSASVASRITLEERFQNTDYLANRPIASYYRFLRNGDENEQEQFEKEWKKAASFLADVLPPNKNNSEEAIHFTVQKKSKFNQHQEYFVFNWHTWEYAGALTRQELTEQLDEHRFHDIRVRYNDQTDEVSLELKDLDGILVLPVKKITIENMSAELQKRMFGEFAPAFKAWRERKDNRGFENRYAFYSDVLLEQEMQIERRANRFDRRSARKYENELNLAWKLAQKSMGDSELMMSKENWVSYTSSISNKLEEFFARQQGGNAISRTLALNRMGVYNCARAVDKKYFQHVAPRFVLSNGQAIPWLTCYVFDENTNSVLRFDKPETAQISLNPATIKMMLVVDNSGNIYQLNDSEVIAMNMGKVAQRIMHLSMLEEPMASNEMKGMLGLVGED